MAWQAVVASIYDDPRRCGEGLVVTRLKKHRTGLSCRSTSGRPGHCSSAAASGYICTGVRPSKVFRFRPSAARHFRILTSKCVPHLQSEQPNVLSGQFHRQVRRIRSPAELRIKIALALMSCFEFGGFSSTGECVSGGLIGLWWKQVITSRDVTVQHVAIDFWFQISFRPNSIFSSNISWRSSTWFEYCTGESHRKYFPTFPQHLHIIYINTEMNNSHNNKYVNICWKFS